MHHDQTALLVGNVITVQEAGSVRCQVGDQVQLRVPYGVYPGGLLSNLNVEVTGSSVRLASIDQTPNLGPDGHPLMGASALTAFLIAERLGDSMVKVTPIGDRPHDPAFYTIEVGLQTE